MRRQLDPRRRIGVNDGLVSNLALVMGMAGGEVSNNVVVLAGGRRLFALISLVTNRGALRSGSRQLALGALAAAGTCLVGRLVGVGLS